MEVADVRDDFIHRVAAGKSFCDVGGLWGTTSEKVSVGHAAGATRLAMIDISEEDHLWKAFRARTTQLRVPQVECVRADVNSTTLQHRFDVVHCSGVMYHSPNPLQMLSALRRLTLEHLILTSAVIPSKIRNAAGKIECSPGQCIFVPSLDEKTMAVVRRHFADRGISGMGGIDTPARWATDNYGPWWWLLTASLIEQMLRVTGFDMVDAAPNWGGNSHSFLARCV